MGIDRFPLICGDRFNFFQDGFSTTANRDEPNLVIIQF